MNGDISNVLKPNKALQLTFKANDVQGLFVLDGSADADEHFGGSINDIRLETAFLDELHEHLGTNHLGCDEPGNRIVSTPYRPVA